MKANPSFLESRRAVALAGLVVAAAAFLAYGNSLGGAFVADDRPSILENPTIRHWSSAFSPPSGWITVSGRPLLNFSLACNYAAGGIAVGGYHAVNLLIHLLAALALFGLVRRTVSDVLFAFAVALLWAVHPLQTESVAYVVQRAESLMGLCYLLTLYCFVRGASGPHPRRWLGLCVGACLAGMLTKEVMVTAPVLVLLYDRTFLAGSFRASWERRRPLYLALAATWLPLAWLVASNGGNRGGSIGIGAPVAAGAYLLTQLPALAHYLRLAVWPHPLVFDYGMAYLGARRETVLAALAVLPLLGLTLIALRRRSPLGFLGAWSFLILAPTSLMPGTRQSLAEHRLYLPLAAVVILLAGGAQATCRRLFAGGGRIAFASACMAVAACYGTMTARRNSVYRNSYALWSDTAAQRPNNGYARASLGALLIDQDRTAEGVAQYEAAVGLLPANAELHYDLANALVQGGRTGESLPQYAEAVRLKPDFALAQCNWAIALARLGRPREALGHFQEAVRLRPDSAELQRNLILIQRALGSPGPER